MTKNTLKYKTDGRSIWNRRGDIWRIYGNGVLYYSARKVIGWNDGNPVLVNRVTSFRKSDVEVVGESLEAYRD